MSSHSIQQVLRRLFVIVAIFVSSAVSAQKVIDKIVAQVGEEIILLSDLQSVRLQQIQNGESGDKTTDCEILENLMIEKLLIHQAQIDSIEVNDDMVNQEMEGRLREIAAKIGSMEELEDFYGKSVAQIKAEFYELIKKKMLAERMRDEITINVSITPKEVKAFYGGLHKDSIPYINSKVTIAQIVIYPQITSVDKQKAKTTCEKYRTQVASKEKSFESIASLYSDDPGSRLTNGDLGWQTRKTMVPEFEAALFKLANDEISPVIETQFGYHFIQMIERRGDNYHCRHVLVTAKVSDAALVMAAGTMDSLYKVLKQNKITFEAAAAKYSNDENSKLNGGMIVNPYTQDYLWDMQNVNDIDPQMSRLIERMKVGDYSSPSLYDNMFEQKQGVRIVKLLKKTEPHVANLEQDRQLIEMAAGNEKRQKVIDLWIQSKIDAAFIRIDLAYLRECKFKYDWDKQI